MNPLPKDTPVSDEAAVRAAIRGDMLRANTAVVVVLGALLILVLAAGLAGFRATQNLRRAQDAEARGQERLANAYLEQARAVRVAAEPGRRQEALNAVSNAAVIVRSTALRAEAIAALALSDLTQEGGLIGTPRNMVDSAMDGALEHLAYVDTHGLITICDARGRTFQTVAAGKPVSGMMFSPDGHFLAVRFSDQELKILDASCGQFMNGTDFTARSIVSFSADSQKLIFTDAVGNGQVTTYNLARRERFSSPVKAGSHMVRVSRDLRAAAVCNGSMVDISDFQTGTNLATLAHAARALNLAWSGDGRKLAVSCEDGDIHLWDLATHIDKVLSGHSERCVSLGFNPEGTMIYSSSLDGSTRVWDLVSGQAIAVGEGIAHGFTSDGQRLGFWRPWAGLGTWRLSASPYYSRLSCDVSAGPLFSIDLSVSGRWCVAIQNKGFRFWDLGAARKEIFVAATNVYGVCIMPDEHSLLVCSTNELAAWPLILDNRGGWALQPENARHILLPDDLGARAVSVSTNGRMAAVELTDRRLVVVDLTGQKPPVPIQSRWRHVNYKGPGSMTGAGRFAISPDGRRVATGFEFDNENVPEIWDAGSGALVTRLNAPTSLVGFSGDGQWLCLAGTDYYSIWSTSTWQKLAGIDRDEPSITHGAMAVFPASGMTALSRTRKMVQLRDWQAHAILTDLISPLPQSVNAIHASLDGSMLVTATASDTVEVWRLGGLRQELKSLGLDWGGLQPDYYSASPVTESSKLLTLTWLSILAVFVIAAGVVLMTLRRHRLAIHRFVVAEAMAAQRNRELDTAKVELMHSQKMQALGTLATGIAHDFNNLLSVVRMSNTLVGRRAVGDAEIQEHVADIEQAVLQGKGVVGSMLGYARDKGANGEPVDVNSVVENVVSLLSREFLGGIALILELEREAPKVTVGRGTLEQILLNLVVNASEAMQGNGNLKIVVRTRILLPEGEYVLRSQAGGPWVEMTVIDSGPGIMPEAQDHIFEPFFTTKNAGARVGTGLGLSLVYTMCEQTEAGLMVKSAPGKGAAFTLLFPALRPTPVRQTHSTKSSPGQ